MKNIAIDTPAGPSHIWVGERLSRLPHYLPSENAIMVTDHRVAELYAPVLPCLPCIRIGRGETIKNLETIERIYRELIALEANRSTFLVGIGGGIVCDVTGFAAATYMRGVPCGYVATTLLAQVDASVGGKTGVNVAGYKNMAGVFRQPRFVICDPMVLKTLPASEISNGMAEIVKHAAIQDARMFAFLEDRAQDARRLNPAVIERLVTDSVVIKARIVNQDEKESGLRRKLNFGHTFGHAIEKISGLPHGAAVSIGMAAAAFIAREKGRLSQKESARLIRLLKRLDLPTTIALEPDALFDAVIKDKKREHDRLNFVLLDGIGKAVVESIALAELRRFTRRMVAAGGSLADET